MHNSLINQRVPWKSVTGLKRGYFINKIPAQKQKNPKAPFNLGMDFFFQREKLLWKPALHIKEKLGENTF